VVSCHVERLLDDRAWSLLSRLQEGTPGGFRIAALLRPPDEEASEAVDPWLERAREAAARSPIGHHTHWGGHEYARPRSGNPALRVRREGAWLRDAGLKPTLFCGGGWYVDQETVEAIADLGYTDCTATAFRPAYLAPTQPQLRARRPCWLELACGRRVLELPSTHSLGMLMREVIRRRALEEPLVHVYFHDTDLLDRARVQALRASLALLGRRRVPTDLDRVSAELRAQDLPVCRL
jgi:hypothetical protein